MSLLNEALRNAEQRQRTSDAPSAYTGQSQAVQHRRKAPWVMLGVMGVVASSMAFGYWLSGAGASSDATAAQVSAGDGVRAPEPVVANPQLIVSQPEHAAENAAPVVAPKPEAAEESRVAADEANTIAIAKQAKTPVQLNSEASAEKEALLEAPEPKTKALNVEEHSAVTAVAVVDQPQQHTTAAADASQASAPVADPAKPLEQARVAEPTEQAPVADVRTTHATPASRDRAAAVSIRDALANGRINEARQTLAEITGAQNAPRSRAQWVRHLLVAGEIQEALRWAPADIASDNTDLRLFRARAQYALGQVDAAIATLQSQVPAVDADPDYAVTLATLLQQDGHYSRAASLWAELIAYDDARSVWWVGLAIALESEQRLESAARAYAQALELPDLSASLRDFVLQRLRAFEVDGSNG